jgi:hypothetical protein
MGRWAPSRNGIASRTFNSRWASLHSPAPFRKEPRHLCLALAGATAASRILSTYPTLSSVRIPGDVAHCRRRAEAMPRRRRRRARCLATGSRYWDCW